MSGELQITFNNFRGTLLEQNSSFKSSFLKCSLNLFYWIYDKYQNYSGAIAQRSRASVFWHLGVVGVSSSNLGKGRTFFYFLLRWQTKCNQYWWQRRDNKYSEDAGGRWFKSWRFLCFERDCALFGVFTREHSW